MAIQKGALNLPYGLLSSFKLTIYVVSNTITVQCCQVSVLAVWPDGYFIFQYLVMYNI